MHLGPPPRQDARQIARQSAQGLVSERRNSHPDADLTATFHLKRPQPALLALLASGYAPVYPCHVSPRDMRQHPIGTGPFTFVEFKPNEYIKVARNSDYWKRDRPFLDGI